MQLIVGLGNPGAQYDRTRHNAGFWLLEALARQTSAVFREERRYRAEIATARLGTGLVTLMKPLTFMNASGQAVAGYANYFRIAVTDILVAHDELDLPPGALRLKQGGGHGGHNGLRDITEKLGADFARLRVGIGHPGIGKDVVNYVLGTPSASDREAIDAAIDRALEVLPLIVGGDLARAMNTLNRRTDSATDRNVGE